MMLKGLKQSRRDLDVSCPLQTKPRGRARSPAPALPTHSCFAERSDTPPAGRDSPFLGEPHFTREKGFIQMREVQEVLVRSEWGNAAAERGSALGPVAVPSPEPCGSSVWTLPIPGDGLS